MDIYRRVSGKENKYDKQKNYQEITKLYKNKICQIIRMKLLDYERICKKLWEKMSYIYIF